MFETLGDHGVRTACTPFLIYRGRTRHELGLEGLLRRVALAATFRHATWGPDELFYGELYSSRKVPCKPTLARPGTRDEYSACCGRELVENDLYDFLLYSLPDNDYHSHKFGPEAQVESIVRADAAFAELVDAAGGLDRVPRRARRDRGRRPRPDRRSSSRCRSPRRWAREWRVLQPNQSDPENAELAVCPSSRAAAVYVLSDGPSWRAHARGSPRAAAGARRRRPVRLARARRRAVAARRRRRPAAGGRGGGRRTRRRAAALSPRRRGQRPPRRRLGPRRRPRGARRRPSATAASTRRPIPTRSRACGAALAAPHAGEILISASPGYELVDWGGITHCPGGSHGVARGRRLARPAAALRARARDRGAPRAVGDRRRRRARARPLRLDAADRRVAGQPAAAEPGGG